MAEFQPTFDRTSGYAASEKTHQLKSCLSKTCAFESPRHEPSGEGQRVAAVSVAFSSTSIWCTFDDAEQSVRNGRDGKNKAVAFSRSAHLEDNSQMPRKLFCASSAVYLHSFYVVVRVGAASAHSRGCHLAVCDRWDKGGQRAAGTGTKNNLTFSFCPLFNNAYILEHRPPKTRQCCKQAALFRERPPCTVLRPATHLTLPVAARTLV